MSSDGGGSTCGDDNHSPNGGNKGVYRKHDWKLVHQWRKISKEKAFLMAERVMTDDLNVVGGLRFQEWPPPKECKM